MTAPESITSEIQKLEPSAIIELFEMDATAFGGDLLRFHAGTNGLRANIVWQGNTYTAFPIQASGFDMSGNGQLPRPKLQVANVTGAITLLVLSYDDLLGAKITRKRTLAKYLDAVNFPARRNLLTYSEQFSNAYWSKTTGGTGAVPVVTENQAANPIDGTLTADLVVFDKGGGTTSTDQSTISPGSLSTVVGQPYAWSFWAKSADGNAYTLRADFNGTSGSPTLFTVGSSWARYSFILGNASDTSRRPMIRLRGGTGSSNYAAIHLFGAQFENSTSISDYQPVAASWAQNPTADPTAEFPDDIFFIDRKVTETRDVVEFELAAAFDVAGVQLPRRQIIQNVCVWRYRGVECGYTAAVYFDANDISVALPAQDACGKRLSSCKARFGQNNPLPFGSFPAAGLTQ